MYDELQKASVWKRISAYLFDAICVGIIIAGVAWMMSSALGYDAYNDKMLERQKFFEEKYDTNFQMTREEFLQLSPEEQQEFEDANKAFLEDEEAIRTYSMMVNLIMLNTAVSTLAGVLVVEFIVPLLLGNGQTFGKKIFGIGVMRTNGVKISPLVLFIRTILGKYTIELMLPALIMVLSLFGSLGMSGTTLVSVFLIVELAIFFVSQKHSGLHDLMARTVVIDMESQRIFDSEEEKLAYLEKMEKEDENRPELY